MLYSGTADRFSGNFPYDGNGTGEFDHAFADFTTRQ